MPLTSGAEPFGEQRCLSVVRNAGIVRRLLHEAVLRFLTGRGYALWQFDPALFVYRQQDLLAMAADAARVSRIGWLHAHPAYKLAARVIYPRDQSPIVGVQIDVHARLRCDLSVRDLIHRGIDIRGRYVCAADDSSPRDVRLDSRASIRLAGRVEGLSADQLRIRRGSDSLTIPIDGAWPEERREVLRAFALELDGNEAAAVFRELDAVMLRLVGGKGRLDRVRTVHSLFTTHGPLAVAADLIGTIAEPYAPVQGSDAGRYTKLGRPKFVFDPGGTKTDEWPNRGLQQFGPFDAESFVPKRPRIVLVTPKDYQGDSEVFMRKLRDGIQNDKTFSLGMVRQYHLDGCTFDVEAFDRTDDDARDYRAACLRCLSKTTKPDLAVVVIREDHRALPASDDPYLVSKAAFMSQGVPVQEVEIETIRVPPELQNTIPYALNNIALASYAKLGGTPFVLASTPGIAHELVIGIGSSAVGTDRFAHADRFVGITTIFSADGNYLLYNKSREAALDDYMDELTHSLREAIGEVQRRNGWQPADSVRLVFHVFKKIKDTEALAVKRLIDSLTDYRVEYAFLHIAEEHGWVLVDENSMGLPDWQSTDPRLRGKRKGAYVPERGYVLPLGRREVLLTTTGPRELKTALQGAPRPLLLELHRESTFEDMSYLARQVFRFTLLSWRSFNASSRPVTIAYSDRIAQLLGQLRQVKNWNPDVLSTMLKGSRLFL